MTVINTIIVCKHSTLLHDTLHTPESELSKQTKYFGSSVVSSSTIVGCVRQCVFITQCFDKPRFVKQHWIELCRIVVFLLRQVIVLYCIHSKRPVENYGKSSVFTASYLRPIFNVNGQQQCRVVLQVFGQEALGIFWYLFSVIAHIQIFCLIWCIMRLVAIV